jgi:hypothetical protein
MIELRRSGLVILVTRNVLVARFTEQMAPFRAVEVGELQQIGHNRSEPIIEGHMELRGDVPGLQIEDQRDRTGVPITDADVDAAL